VKPRLDTASGQGFSDNVGDRNRGNVAGYVHQIGAGTPALMEPVPIGEPEAVAIGREPDQQRESIVYAPVSAPP
jgi:hypothetical protein